jgi:hypothetical protein
MFYSAATIDERAGGIIGRNGSADFYKKGNSKNKGETRNVLGKA